MSDAGKLVLLDIVRDNDAERLELLATTRHRMRHLDRRDIETIALLVDAMLDRSNRCFGEKQT